MEMKPPSSSLSLKSNGSHSNYYNSSNGKRTSMIHPKGMLLMTVLLASQFSSREALQIRLPLSFRSIHQRTNTNHDGFIVSTRNNHIVSATISSSSCATKLFSLTTEAASTESTSSSSSSSSNKSKPRFVIEKIGGGGRLGGGARRLHRARRCPDQRLQGLDGRGQRHDVPLIRTGPSRPRSR